MIHSGLWVDEHFAKLSDKARLLWISCVNHADDDGRLSGNIANLRGMAFRFDDISLEKVENLLAEIKVNMKNFRYYSVNGCDYIEFGKWKVYQKLRKDRTIKSSIPKCQPNVNQMSTKCQPKLSKDNLTKPNLNNIAEQAKRLFDSFDKNLQNKIEVYIDRVCKKNKSGVITEGRKVTLLNELFTTKDRCNNDEIFGYAMDQAIGRDACNIGYINAIIKNKKTQKPSEGRAYHNLV